MIHLDTHVVVWLYAGETERFPPEARRRLDGDRLVVSPIVELELQYLHEIGRTTRPGNEVIADLVARIGLARSTAPFAAVVVQAAGLAWSRDPFDRLIVGAAMAEGCGLLTRHEPIRRNFSGAVWDGSAPA